MMIEGRSIENLLLPFHRMGQQCWLEEHRRPSHVIRIGDRWPDTLATHPPASLKVACVQIRASTGCVRAPLDTVPLRKRNGTSRRGRPWRLFACGQIYAKKLKYELGRLAAISRGLWRALRLGLRIAVSISRSWALVFGGSRVKLFVHVVIDSMWGCVQGN